MNNNYKLLSTIDGILSRLWAVRVFKTLTGPQGPTQWLFLAEPKSSLEDELVRLTTAPSAPCFYGSGIPQSAQILSNLAVYYEVPPTVIDPNDGATQCANPELPLRDDNGSSLPRPKKGQIAHCVDFRLVQVLSGIRAVLLVLIDSCAVCAADSDFIGNQPSSDVFTAARLMSTWTEESFVPNAKYWKDWPLARFLRNPLPPRPDSWTHGYTDPLFSGETGSYFRRLATYDWRRPDSFNFYRAVFGIAQSKRGFAAVPASFVQRTLAKHARQLSTPPTSDPDLGYARLFLRTFLGENWRPPRIFDSLPLLDASPRASVESTRAQGGARAFLQTLSKKLTGSSHFDQFLGFREIRPGLVVADKGIQPLTPQLWRKLADYYTPTVARSYLPKHIGKAVDIAEKEYLDSLSKGPLELYLDDIEAHFDDLRAEGELTEDFLYRHNIARQHQRELDREGLRSPFNSLPFARVAPILEPLKVRTITAMDAVRGHIARPLQGALFKVLRKSPQFSLIGEPVSESLLHDLLERHRKDAGSKPTDEFVSGDYSAATDGLDIRLSRALLEIILDRLHPEDLPYRHFIASSLMEQVLVYPPGGPQPTPQRNGQLMGSVLSFPFLCLANFFAYIMARPDVGEILQSRSRMNALPVLINGDDILFRTNQPFYERWLWEISHVGFVPSVGKNFKHPRFFTVNSVPIEFVPAPTVQEYWSGMDWADIDAVGDRIDYFGISQVPTVTIGGFLNVGLLTGQAKLTGKEDKQNLPLSAWHAQSVLNSLNPRKSHGWFLHYHEKEILQQTRFGGTTLNLFAHPLLGGLGFAIPEGVEPRFSPEQRRIAHSLFLSACYTYNAQEKDFSLPSLIALTAPSLGSARVGSIPRKVEIMLYPLGTPLPPNLEEFVDQSGIDPIVMSNPHLYGEGIQEDFKTTVSCRLSGSRIRSLTKRFGIHTVALHPVESMTYFPFLPVRVTDESAIRLYSPLNPFQDINVEVVEEWEPPFAFDDTIPVGTEVTRSVIEPEDWETQDFRLLLPQSMREVTSETPALPAVRQHPGRARLRASQAFNRKFPRPSKPAYMTEGV